MTPDDLRAARQRLGLNQTQFAARIGLIQQNVSRWESGAKRITPMRAVWLEREIARVAAELEQERAGSCKESARG